LDWVGLMGCDGIWVVENHKDRRSSSEVTLSVYWCRIEILNKDGGKAWKAAKKSELKHNILLLDSSPSPSPLLLAQPQ
jgi:hypothetical protein